jgi:hypothetical protein
VVAPLLEMETSKGIGLMRMGGCKQRLSFKLIKKRKRKTYSWALFPASSIKASLQTSLSAIAQAFTQGCSTASIEALFELSAEKKKKKMKKKNEKKKKSRVTVKN